jgi:site-specific DNA recombinase
MQASQQFLALKRCYGYIRVSTSQQADDGLSLENQRNKIEAWASLNDYLVLDVYADEGFSGRTMEKRKDLAALLEIIKTGEALVVYTFSRLSRSAADFLNLNRTLTAKGCQIVVIREGLDTTSPHGRFAATMFAAIAELESDVIADRIQDSMNLKKEKGEFVGRIPYGWQLSNGPQSDLIEKPDEQTIITRVKAMRKELNSKGKETSYEDIAKKLNAEKVPPPVKSAMWYHNTVSRIVNRGEIKTKGRDPSARSKGKIVVNTTVPQQTELKKN